MSILHTELSQHSCKSYGMTTNNDFELEVAKTYIYYRKHTW